MSKKNSVSRFFATIGSAISAANAVENHQKVQERDLRALGINPIEFSRIGRTY